MIFVNHWYAAGNVYKILGQKQGGKENDTDETKIIRKEYLIY